jgi:HPt (histidine-containing phosphotransfer) domain-containing protein
LLAVAHQGLHDGDAMMVALAAHSLMGGAAFLGADALHTRCAQIERLADGGELDAIKPHLDALKTELAQALEEIAEPGKNAGQ